MESTTMEMEKYLDKRIGFLIISKGWAGAENSLYNLVKNIKKNKIFLITNEEIINNYKDLLSKNVKIKSLGKAYKSNNFSTFLNYSNIANKLLKIIKINKIEVIYLFLEDSIIVFDKIIKKANINFILSLRGTEVRLYNTRNLFYKLRYIHIYKPISRMIKKAKIIHSHSKWQTDKLDSNKIRVIPNGVDFKLFHPVKLKKENIVLFSGRYVNWKGINEIINVSRGLKNYKFYFVGRGPLEEDIKGENIKNLGFKNKKDLLKLYNKATICIFPSWNEPFGNVGLEAMACGKPVIATPLGFSEYIENGKDGIIIPAKDEKALKEAIVKLMENPKLRERLGKAARKKAEQYSWEKVAKQYLKLIKEVDIK